MYKIIGQYLIDYIRSRACIGQCLIGYIRSRACIGQCLIGYIRSRACIGQCLIGYIRSRACALNRYQPVGLLYVGYGLYELISGADSLKKSEHESNNKKENLIKSIQNSQILM